MLAAPSAYLGEAEDRVAEEIEAEPPWPNQMWPPGHQGSRLKSWCPKVSREDTGTKIWDDEIMEKNALDIDSVAWQPTNHVFTIISPSSKNLCQVT